MLTPRTLLESSPANRFATFFYSELDLEQHELEYVSGGHNPALLATDGGLEELMPTGPIGTRVVMFISVGEGRV